jgi:hypothetical protein
MYDIFFVSNNIDRSKDVLEKIKKRFPVIKKASSFDEAKKKSISKFFWVIWDDIILDDSFDFSYVPDTGSYDYVHVFKNGNQYDGVCLVPKNSQISKREIEYRFFINKKEIDILASTSKPYDGFTIDSYEEYLEALEKTTTDMFWMTSSNIRILDTFDLSFRVGDIYDKIENHVFIHQEEGKDLYNGLFLCSVKKPLSQKEVEHRFPIHRKEWDIVATVPVVYDVFTIDSYEEYLEALEKTTYDMFWMTSSNIRILDTFDLSFRVTDKYHKNENHVFIHQEEGKDLYNGLFLCSVKKPLSQKEVEHRFPISRKEWDIVATVPVVYDVFTIDSYEEYLEALEKTTYDMFWMTSSNIRILDTFDLSFRVTDKYHKNENHVFIHKVNGNDLYNGLFLCSVKKPLSQKEVEYRFPISRKEWDIVATVPVVYDVFTIDSYEEYLEALQNTKTEMFWVIPKEIDVLETFSFSNYYFEHSNIYDRSINHAFKNIFMNEENYEGIKLLSKKKIISKREIEYRILLERKEHSITASKNSLYDIVFISYNEPNAEENYNRLKDQFPRVKRIHNVKGIHQAHIAAAKIAKTEMFWVVDGDAQIVNNFDFSYIVTRYERDIVHVWESKNPINDLSYGYGGVKLLPKYLTENMDVNSVDMTTSISTRFKPITHISNITVFNTDPFNTWKSAFRECVKLSSRIIDGQDDQETVNRLSVWCSKGIDQLYGEYAIKGAMAGREFGFKYVDNKVMLSKINDWQWLEDEFKNTEF